MNKEDAVIEYQQKAREATHHDTVFERQAVEFGYDARDNETCGWKRNWLNNFNTECGIIYCVDYSDMNPTPACCPKCGRKVLKDTP